jgi:hypothetical protein
VGQHNPNRLVVEGVDDKYSVACLMAQYLNWPTDNHPVEIEVGNGAPEILKDAYLTTLLKSSDLKILGIMLDADINAVGRYQSVYHLLVPTFPNMPQVMPTEGLITDNAERRLGVWIMPDNKSEGYLETFLKFLIPDYRKSLVWKHAVDSVTEARNLKAPYHDCEIDKANLYTWLAWQHPSGQSPGRALTKKILDPQTKSAELFVQWFRNLYRL